METNHGQVLNSTSAAANISMAEPATGEAPTVDALQDWLVDKLAQILNIDPDDIEVTKPFSRYGLDSSATIVLTSDLIDWLGLDIQPDTIFQYPTVSKLASHLDELLTQA